MKQKSYRKWNCVRHLLSVQNVMSIALSLFLVFLCSCSAEKAVQSSMVDINFQKFYLPTGKYIRFVVTLPTRREELCTGRYTPLIVKGYISSLFGF